MLESLLVDTFDSYKSFLWVVHTVIKVSWHTQILFYASSLVFYIKHTVIAYLFVFTFILLDFTYIEFTQYVYNGIGGFKF